jgi:glycerate kinase
VLVAAGGSATTDGGNGALEALRAAGALDAAAIEVLCDVRTPYEDAARVFAPQKGADADAIERLSARLDRLAAELPRDPRGVPMGGCAGGLSGGLWGHGARLRSGAAFVLEAIGFDRRLAAADAVVSGEGRFDAQSLAGKIVGEIASRCSQVDKPLHLVVGGADPGTTPPAAISSITQAESLEEMRRVASGLVSPH